MTNMLSFVLGWHDTENVVFIRRLSSNLIFLADRYVVLVVSV